MKRLVVLLLAIVMMFSLSACGKSEEAQAVDDQILAIGDVTLEGEEIIIDAENAVSELTEKDQKKLDNLTVLEQARATYDNLLAEKNAGLAAVVDEVIAAIGTVTLDSGDAISAARTAYDEHDARVQAVVGSYSALTDAESMFAELRVDNASTLISNIGAVSVENADKVKAARKAYDILSADEVAKVTNEDTLTKAESKLSNLMVEHTDALIAAIGTVTIDSADALIAAEEAFKALSNEETAKLANAAVLTEAVAAYDILEARALIQVTKVWCSSPDSAGGVELYFNFVNNSENVIKYIDFGVTFYNSVGDVVQCKYDKVNINYCYDTGPYAKGEGRSGTYWSWGDFYNWDIESVELVYLSIEYMDETTITLTSDQVEYVQY